MAEYLIQDTTLSDIANAIREKTGKSDAMTPYEMPDEIASIQTGGAPLPDEPVQYKDVNFYDYDGTLVEAWTLEELAGKNALPANPAHAGLTAQGWNWSLEDLKSTNRPMNVGQMYVTDDGKTRLYITIAAPGRQDVPLYISQTVANGVIIDWGDGSPTETLAGTGNVNTAHHYAEIGDYVITLNQIDGCTLGLESGSSNFSILGDSSSNSIAVYPNMLRRVEIGNRVTSVGDYAFYSCNSLEFILIPNNITRIGISALSSCYSLRNVSIPNSVTDLYGSSQISSCYLLRNVSIPNSITTLPGSLFSYCSALVSITIPDSITNIESQPLYYCDSLVNITIPSNVTSIGYMAFEGCASIKEFHFRSVVPPNLLSANVFSNTPSDCIIYVPQGALSAYQSAENWSDYAERIQEEPN